MKVIVLGAGALGTAAALHLARSGHEVHLIEEVQVAGRTTGLAAGLLTLSLTEAYDRALTLATMDGLTRLEAAHPSEGADVGPLLHRPGSHILAAPGAETEVVHRLAEGVAAMDQPHEVLAPQEWADTMQRRGIDVETHGLASVLSLPKDAWALSTEATQLMARAAKAAGVQVRIARAERLIERDGAVCGVRLADGTSLEADGVVVALGAWTRGFLETHGLVVPAQGYRTHAAVVRTPFAARMPIIHDNAGRYYLRPEGPHHLLIGDGTRTEAITPEGFTNDAEPFFMEGIAERLPQRFPGLGGAQLQNAWRGILTGIPDRHPLVGAHPDREGLWLCTGGNGYGFMRSYALGACLAGAIDDAAPDGFTKDILHWMDPARFWPDPPTEFAVTEGFELVPPTPLEGGPVGHT